LFGIQQRLWIPAFAGMTVHVFNRWAATGDHSSKFDVERSMFSVQEFFFSP